VIEAREKATLVCPSCGAAWSEADRAAANRGGEAAAQGPVDPPGRNDHRPDAPATLTLGFRFTAANNLLVSMPRVAEEEWSAPRRTTRTGREEAAAVLLDAAQRARVGHAQRVRRRRDLRPRRSTSRAAACRPTRPSSPSASTSASGCATGWRSPGGRAARRTSPTTACSTCPAQSMAEELAILSALRKFRDEICANGWPVLAAGGVAPPPVDDAAEPDAGRQRLLGIDRRRLLPRERRRCSSRQGVRRPAARPPQDRASPGTSRCRSRPGHSLVEINADYWKSFVHARLQTPAASRAG
jgi:hypothetical protein